MNNDKNKPPLQAPASTANKPANNSTNTNTTAAKEHTTLLPKTIEEIKEIETRIRKRMSKRKYIVHPNRFKRVQQQQPNKSEEELKLEQLQKQKDIKELQSQIDYSQPHQLGEFEYIEVVLPMNLSRWLPQDRLLVQKEWVEVGVHLSPGWEHYMIYKPEPHVLLFKRELDHLAKYGDHDPQ